MNKQRESRSKVLSLVLALAMMITTLIPVVAGAAPTPTNPEKTKTVHLHKLLLDNSTDLENWTTPEGYDGTQDFSQFQGLDNGRTYSEIAGVYFAFKNEAGQWMMKDGSAVDDLPDELTVEKMDEIGYLGGLTTGSGFAFNTAGLNDGNYKIVEIPELSTYKDDEGNVLTGSKAVPLEITLPLVNQDGIQETVHVYPKNIQDKPIIDKDFEGEADASSPNPKEQRDYMVGDEVPYEVQTIIPADAKYAVLKWSDRMSPGLTFKKAADGGGIEITSSGEALVAGDYILREYSNGFDLILTEQGLAKVNNKENPVTITLKYNAILNDEAVVNVPETNDIKLVYGNQPQEESTPVPVEPQDGKITITKTWASGQAPDGVTATFDVYDKDGNLVETVTLPQNTDEWVYTLTGLDQAKGPYTVVERVINGYTPEYIGGQYGQVTINNKPTDNPDPLNPEEPKVVTYGKKFIKKNKDGQSLTGATFYVKNEAKDKYLGLKDPAQVGGEIAAYEAAEAAYQQAVKDQAANIDQLKIDRDNAYIAMNTEWKWVDSKDDAFLFHVDGDGILKVEGLAEGTYYLEEVDVPEGYAKPAGDFMFKVDENSWTSGPAEIPHDGEYQIIENKLVTIPETGGIGSLLFVVAGLAIMGATLVIKRRRNAEQM